MIEIVWSLGRLTLVKDNGHYVWWIAPSRKKTVAIRVGEY